MCYTQPHSHNPIVPQENRTRPLLHAGCEASPTRSERITMCGMCRNCSKTLNARPHFCESLRATAELRNCENLDDVCVVLTLFFTFASCSSTKDDTTWNHSMIDPIPPRSSSRHSLYSSRSASPVRGEGSRYRSRRLRQPLMQHSAPPPATREERAKADAEFLISLAKFRGCFRVRYVAVLLTILAALQLLFFWWMLVDNFQAYLQRASSDVCSATAAMVDSQMVLFITEVMSRMRVANTLASAVLENQDNPNTMFENETFYQTDLCSTFYGGWLALAAYYTNGTRMFYTPCASYLASPTLSSETLPLTMQLTTPFDVTTGQYTTRFINGVSVVANGNTTSTVIVAILMSKVVFGWVLLGAITPAYSTLSLLRSTSVLITVGGVAAVNTLSYTDTPNYTTAQPTPTASRLLERFETACSGGRDHTWYTGGVDDDDGSVGARITTTAIPVPNIVDNDDDDGVAVMCGVVCQRDAAGQCISSELRIVVETPIKATTSTIEAFKLIASCAGGISVFVVFLLTLSITVPINVLQHRIIAVLSGVPWKRTRTQRFLICTTRWFWIRDITALMRQFHIMALFFTANRKYVPEFVLFRQMDLLRGDREIEKLLASLTLEDWAASITGGTSSPLQASGGGEVNIALGREGSVIRGEAVQAAGGASGLASADHELELLRFALVAEHQQQQQQHTSTDHQDTFAFSFLAPLASERPSPGRAGDPHLTTHSRRNTSIISAGRTGASVMFPRIGTLDEDVDLMYNNGSTLAPTTTTTTSVSTRQQRQLTQLSSDEMDPTHQATPIPTPTAAAADVDRLQGLEARHAAIATLHDVPSSDALAGGRVGSLMGLSYIDSATLMTVMVGGLEDAFGGAFDLTARQHRKIFTAIHVVVRKHEGNIYERTGESMSVSWNAFEARADHALRAVRCAHEMSEMFKAYRKGGLRLGIVVHQGPVVCGITGDNREVASTLFGHARTFTGRLAHLAAQLTFFSVLITEPVKKSVSIFFECAIVDVIRDGATGRTTSIFDVRRPLLDLNSPRGRQPKSFVSQSDFVVDYTIAFASFRAHAFGDALDRLATLQRSHPNDPLVSRLTRLCVYYRDGDRDAQLPRPYIRAVPRWSTYEADAESTLPSLAEVAATRSGISASKSPRLLEASNGASLKRAVLTHARHHAALQNTNKESTFATELRTTMEQHAPPNAVAASPPSNPRASASLGAISADDVVVDVASGGAALTSQKQIHTPIAPHQGTSSASNSTPSRAAGTAPFENTLIESVGWSLAPGPPPLAPPAASAHHLQDSLPHVHTGGSSAATSGQHLVHQGAVSEHHTPGSAKQKPEPSTPNALPDIITTSSNVTFVRSCRVLGTGSFGCVYMGMEQHTGRLVAMKFLPQPTAEGEVRLLQNEVATMETVVDPHLVEFYGYAFVDRMIVLMMECMVAGSLAGMLATFLMLPEPTVVNFMRDVLQGLHRLHSMGIVHRDVKPQNVLIAANGHCKISDFGASASIHELVRRHDGGAEVQGTPIYLAPEAARGHAETKSDVWSVGIMYLQLTTGSIPYDASGISGGVGAVVFGIGSGRLLPVIPSSLSPLARAFVEGCLAPDANRRLSAQQLLDLPLFSV